MNVDCFAFHADCFAFHAETGQMTADGWPSRYIDAELRGPDPGWIETLFDHPRTCTLMVENCSSSLMNLCFSDERGEGSDGERYTHRERDCGVSGEARRAAPRSRRALRTGSPLGSLSFRRHKARGSGLKTTRARRALREYLLTKVAVVLCISNSTSALCHVVVHR